MKRGAALAAVVLAACSGESGTITVGLATAPGSPLLDSVQTLRITLTNPEQTTTVERTSDGFVLALELPATGETTAMLVDGLDASGALIANGASPRFPLGALDGRILIYMAAPNTLGPAPLAVDPPRAELAAGNLGYGAILAGGTLADGTTTDAVQIYNAFDHTLVTGLAMPEPRAALALGVGANGIVYLFGGRTADGTDASTLWRFDTTAQPAGSYADFGDKPGFARTGQLALPLGSERFLVTGSPVAELFGLDGSVVAKTDVPSLPAAGASVTATDGVATTITAGSDAVTRYRGGSFTALAVPEATRAGASVIALPGGRVGVFCGTTTAVRIDAAGGTGEPFANVPSTTKTGCAVAATARHVLVAGGTLAAGGVDATAEIYDATTLALVTSQQLSIPRTNAIAIALPNDQILIAGGTDASGAPVGTLELFTPAN